MTKKIRHTGNAGIYIVAALLYFGLIIYFAYQTWGFVSFLFPTDQFQMKILAVVSFDCMALFWAVTDVFYSFASRAAHVLVKWAWGISFCLSLVASIFYLVISTMFRFHVVITRMYINLGDTIVIASLTLSILFLTFFMYHEWNIRHPHEEHYLDEPVPQMSNSFSQLAVLDEKELDTEPTEIRMTAKELDAFFESWTRQEKKRGKVADGTVPQPNTKKILDN